MSCARRLVSVQNVDGKASTESVKMPAVFLSPIRPDIVTFVHTNMNKNRRQAYAVQCGWRANQTAGHKHSAHSWGTGRAVSRIPRVSGGGTSRAGQAAFGNMCRKGRMFAPTQTWRKWHRKINTNQKRYAVCSALAASALPALVMGRGHLISEVVDVPCVVDNSVESIQKTKDAVAALKAVGAYDDVEKAGDSKKIRSGVGKMRNRRHVMRRGPLVVFAEDHGVTKAFRNLPGVDLACVDRLNLLQLAPGGHLGRFCIFTKAAFEKCEALFGSTKRESTQKKGFNLPAPIMTNTDVTRLINSDSVQSVVRPAVVVVSRKAQKKNPLTNFGVRVRLNPYAMAARRSELLLQEQRLAQKAARVEASRKNLPVERSSTEKAKLAANKKHRANKKSNFANLVVPNLVADVWRPSPRVVARAEKAAQTAKDAANKAKRDAAK